MSSWTRSKQRLYSANKRSFRAGKTEPSPMVSQADILHAKILVVDDKPANVLLLEGMLRVAGYTCVNSTNVPGSVCALHRDAAYDLILLDLQMPGMDGFQVMEELKKIETESYLPVLVITAQ